MTSFTTKPFDALALMVERMLLYESNDRQQVFEFAKSMGTAIAENELKAQKEEVKIESETMHASSSSNVVSSTNTNVESDAVKEEPKKKTSYDRMNSVLPFYNQFVLLDPSIVKIVDLHQEIFEGAFDIFQLGDTHHERIAVMMDKYPRMSEADFYLLDMGDDYRPTQNLHFALMAWLIRHKKGEIKLIDWNYHHGPTPQQPFKANVYNVTKFMAMFGWQREATNNKNSLLEAFSREGLIHVLFQFENNKPSPCDLDNVEDFYFDEREDEDCYTISEHVLSHRENKSSGDRWSKTVIDLSSYCQKIISRKITIHHLSISLERRNVYGLLTAATIYALGLEKHVHILCYRGGQFMDTMPAWTE